VGFFLFTRLLGGTEQSQDVPNNYISLSIYVCFATFSSASSFSPWSSSSIVLNKSEFELSHICVAVEQDGRLGDWWVLTTAGAGPCGGLTKEGLPFSSS